MAPVEVEVTKRASAADPGESSAPMMQEPGRSERLGDKPFEKRFAHRITT
jgi:hypothetical protein